MDHLETASNFLNYLLTFVFEELTIAWKQPSRCVRLGIPPQTTHALPAIFLVTMKGYISPGHAFQCQVNFDAFIFLFLSLFEK